MSDTYNDEVYSCNLSEYDQGTKVTTNHTDLSYQGALQLIVRSIAFKNFITATISKQDSPGLTS